MNEVSLEKKIVAASIKDRASFERISEADSGEYSPYSEKLLQLVAKFYDRDKEAKRVDSDVLAQWIERDITPKSQNLYLEYLKEVVAIDVSAINIADLVVETTRANVGNRLAAALLERKDVVKIQALMDQYAKLGDAGEQLEQEEYINISVADVVSDATDESQHIKLLPRELNRATKGKARRGHTIVVMARPDAGKTAMTLTLTRAFAAQKLSTIIFGNEEPVRDTILRAQCALTGMTEEELIEAPEKAQGLLDRRGWEYIRFIPLSPGTPQEIARYVEKYKPDVIVVDQLRNLNVGTKDNKVNQLERAATELRNIAKKYNCLVVMVTQAGDSADGKQYLGMGDCDSSNTGIPAQADLMIGIGMNKEYEDQGLRGISLPKNKIGGVHSRFPVKFNPQISRMEDV